MAKHTLLYIIFGFLSRTHVVSSYSDLPSRPSHLEASPRLTTLPSCRSWDATPVLFDHQRLYGRLRRALPEGAKSEPQVQMSRKTENGTSEEDQGGGNCRSPEEEW